jgi:hypothetical protein
VRRSFRHDRFSARPSARSGVIALGSFQRAENELKAGALVAITGPKLNLRTGHGLIGLKDRALSPAPRAFMEEFLDEERRCERREQEMERRYVIEGRQNL